MNSEICTLFHRSSIATVENLICIRNRPKICSLFFTRSGTGVTPRQRNARIRSSFDENAAIVVVLDSSSVQIVVLQQFRWLILLKIFFFSFFFLFWFCDYNRGFSGPFSFLPFLSLFVLHVVIRWKFDYSGKDILFSSHSFHFRFPDLCNCSKWKCTVFEPLQSVRVAFVLAPGLIKRVVTYWLCFDIFFSIPFFLFFCILIVSWLFWSAATANTCMLFSKRNCP